MAVVFGGRIHVHEELTEEHLTELALKDLSKTAPEELEAAAKAAAAVEEQRLLLERLEARRDALRRQVEDLQYANMPNVRPLVSGEAGGAAGSAGASSESGSVRRRAPTGGGGSAAAERRRGKKRPLPGKGGRAGGGAAGGALLGGSGRATNRTRMDTLPILTTTGELPFEIGLEPTMSTGGGGGGGGGEPGAPVPKAMPVFSLPAVGENVRFVRRIPRPDRPEEARARQAEAMELEHMKVTLGLTDRELMELEAELGVEPDPYASRNVVQAGMADDMNNLPPLPLGADPDRAAVPPLYGGDSGRRRGEEEEQYDESGGLRGRSTPRCLKLNWSSGAGLSPSALRSDLTASLDSYDKFSDAVRSDIRAIQQLGIPITNARASKFMRKWGLDRLNAVIDRMYLSLQGAGFTRWANTVRAEKKKEKLDAYLQYQGTRRMGLFLRNFILRKVAVVWLTWWDLVAKQRAEEQARREDWAACLLQRRYRGHAARNEFMIKLAELQAARRDRAARLLQAWARGLATRANFRAMLRARAANAAALVVQCACRQYLARKRLQERREAQARELAALRMQSIQRGRVARRVAEARRQEEREKRASALLQRVVRGRQGRKKVTQIKRDIVEGRAAQAMQKRARGMLARKRVVKMREEATRERAKQTAAALKIQKVYRGHRGRLVTSLKLSQSRTRRMVQTRAATKIASGLRGMMARKRCQELRKVRDEQLMDDARLFQEVRREGRVCIARDPALTIRPRYHPSPVPARRTCTHRSCQKIQAPRST